MIYIALILVIVFIYVSVSGGTAPVTNDPVVVSDTVNELAIARTAARNQVREDTPSEPRVYSETRPAIIPDPVTVITPDPVTLVSPVVTNVARRVAGTKPAVNEPSGDAPAPVAPVSVFTLRRKPGKQASDHGTGQIVGI